MPKVLVVDDEDAYCSLMAGHLTRKGFEVASAHTGEEGIEIAKQGGPFEVIVTDLSMPGMSGLDLLRNTKARDPWLEVIVITASDDIETAIEVMREDGAFDYLIKPLGTMNELSMAVSRAIQHRKLRLERAQLDGRLTEEAVRLQALLENTGDPILLADSREQITVANPAARKLFGGALVESNAMDVLPADFQDCVLNWREIGEKDPVMVEIQWPENAVQLVSLTAIPEGKNDEFGWAMVIRDITHLRNIDELKMRMLKEASNKIRIPLAQATSSLAELGEQVGDQEIYSTTIYRLATLLGRIQEWMDELMALIRIEAGIGLQQTELDLHTLISRELKNRFEETYQDRKLRLKIKLEKRLPLVRVDPALMERMIEGLISRAASRSPREGTVRLNARRRRDQVWLEVRDEAVSARMADWDNTVYTGQASVEGEGRGFDLEMVRAIVNSMGGQVWIKGGDAVGSSVAISLPIVREDAHTADTMRDWQTSSGKKAG